MRVGIVAKRGSARAVGLAGEIAAALDADGVAAVVDEATHDAMTGDGGDDPAADAGADAFVPPGRPAEDLADCALAVSVGGDGTFLYTARAAGGTPLLGINLGEVGFLTAVEPEAAVETVCDVVAEIRDRGSPRTTAVPRLAGTAPDATLAPAVNEVVLTGPRRGHGGGVDVAVDVDGRRYTAGHADGVLVATPVGSTAYNLSERGPVVDPGVDALVVTVMAGNGTMPPLVADGDATVSLTVRDADEAVAVVDGRVRRTLSPPTTLEVALDAAPLSIAEPSLDFYAALEKLN